jgi:hypothetical protein
MKKFIHTCITLIGLVTLSTACSLAQPTSTQVSETTVPDNSFRVTYRNISFVTPPFYSNRIIAEELDLAEQPAPDIWPPSYFQIQFHDQADLAFADSLPSLVLVYPVAELSLAYAGGADTVATLQSLLMDNQAFPSAELPFWPLEYYTQVAGAPLATYGQPALTVHVQYLEFQSGQGVRYLTFMENNVTRTSRMDRLIYTFQGLTSDEKYYISVIIPLFVNDDITRTLLNSFATQNPPDYSGMTEKLDGLTEDAFHLSLAECDDLIASLSVTP